jgi:hypothetical protein
MRPCECHDDLTCPNCLWEKREQAKAEAYEDAARICEASVTAWDGDPTHINICKMDPLELAEAIRARAKGLK